MDERGGDSPNGPGYLTSPILDHVCYLFAISSCTTSFPFITGILAQGQSSAASLINFSKLSNFDQIRTIDLV